MQNKNKEKLSLNKYILISKNQNYNKIISNCIFK